MKDRIGILGGTFDPIHRGHLAIADIVLHRLQCTQIRFIPCKTPVLKDAATASHGDRLEMLKLALHSEPRFVADDRELKRDTPSYTIDTLKSLQADFPEATLLLILGEDSFNQLPAWHQWQSLLSYCHIIVVERKGAAPITDKTFLHTIAESEIEKTSWLSQKQHGYILKMSIPPISHSSTAIRKAIQQGKSIHTQCPFEVSTYIETHKLYR